MISIQTKTHVGADGTLSLQIPTTLRETDVEVMVVFQPVPPPESSSVNLAQTPVELGWPAVFFENTYGSLKDDPIERGPQGEHGG
jgi:hypothetical protein